MGEAKKEGVEVVPVDSPKARWEAVPARARNIYSGQGLVAFVDILGYRSFLANNGAVAAALPVLDILSGLKHDVSARLRRFLDQASAGSDEIGASLDKYIPEMRWLVFSDSILIAMRFAEGGVEPVEAAARWWTFLLTCGLLSAHMLTSGLPVRGAVTYGTFAFEESCFVGRAIVDAHEFGQRLDLAATVLTPDASATLGALKGC